MLHTPKKTSAGLRIRRKDSLFAAAIACCLAILAFPSFFRFSHPSHTLKTTTSRIEQDPATGLFSWSAGDQPFYLRGVVYQPGDKPRTKKLHKDLSLIRDMGANAVICQGKEITAPVWQAAAANDLKVIARLPLDSSAVTALRQIQPNALLALALSATDISPEKALTILAEIRQAAPDLPIILDWPQAEIPDQLLLLADMVNSPAHAASKPFLALDLGKTASWDTIAYGMSWPLRYPEASSYEEARSYAQLWKNLEENRGHNLGGAVYRWRDRQTENGALPGLTDHKGRLKPAYYALQELWTGQPRRFPLQDVILKTDHIFHNGENFYQISALSPFGPEKETAYEWYIGSDSAHQIPVLLANGNAENSFLDKLKRKFRENAGMSCYTLHKGSIFRIRQDHTLPDQRIYLYISDNDNHVVTASMPIDPNHIIQRIPWQ